MSIISFIIKDLLALLDQVYYKIILSDAQTLQVFTINVKSGGVYHIYKGIQNAKLESFGEETC